MKINLFTAFISIALAAIISYFFSYFVSNINSVLIAIGSFISFFIVNLGLFSANFEYEKTTFLTRIASGIFACIMLIVQLVFFFYSTFSPPVYILFTGIFILLYVLIIYGISKSKH
jgi:hypothetical protein